jgi:hypothetical protein
MLTKLTLTIDKAVVEQAKEYAQGKNRSVSRIVEEYLKKLSPNRNPGKLPDEIKAPITDGLSGMFKDPGMPYNELLDAAMLEKYL